MAIVLEANYAKKLGLPNYSSHQYSVTIRTELTDLTQIEEASTRLYGLLQDAVDREIKAVGYMPDASTYGMHSPSKNANGPSGPSGGPADPGRGNGHAREPDHARNGNGSWHCSEKQRGLIEKIVRENQLDKRTVEELAIEMFSAGVKELDRLQASGLIDELLERHGGKQRGGRRPYRREPAHNSARGGGEG